MRRVARFLAVLVASLGLLAIVGHLALTGEPLQEFKPLVHDQREIDALLIGLLAHRRAG